jgi:hypothetical protein
MIKTNPTIQEVKTKLEQMRAEKVPVYSENTEIPGYELIRTVNEKRPIRILSKKYHIEQHDAAFDRVVDKLEKSHLNYNIQSFKTNESNGRNSMQVTFGFPEISWDVDGSETMATFDIINSTDGLTKYSELFGLYRLVCSNGMVIGETIYRQIKKHSKNFIFNLDDFEGFYDTLLETKKFGELFEKSQEVKITKKFMQMLIKAGFSSRLVLNLPEAYEKYQTMYRETIKDYTKLWAYWAVLTNWLSNKVAKTDIKRANLLNQSLTRLMISELSNN